MTQEKTVADETWEDARALLGEYFPTIGRSDALIKVDVQNDFCPGGSLGVNGGDEIIKPLNVLQKYFLLRGGTNVNTRDWHPRKTSHFKEFGGIWPVHCVRGTNGAMFHHDLNIVTGTIIVSKGLTDKDDYSGFDGVDETGRRLNEILLDKGIKRVFVGGLATDYCVKFTVLDALNLGYEVILIPDAIRAVNLNPGDGGEAIDEMIAKGAYLSDWKPGFTPMQLA